MLITSRSDISTTEVTEYPVDKRFIKLPIANYLKLLGAWDELNSAQLALINAVNSPQYRFVCAALARRLGKTYIANVIGQLVTLVPNSAVLLVSPNYSLSSISFELQRRFIGHFDLEIARNNLKDKIIELDNGSTIRMGSISTVDSCVGRSYDLIIFDEAALTSAGEAAFNIQLRPTLDKPNSKAIFISTPRGRNNWFSQFFQRGFSLDFPEWCSIQADYLENPRMSDVDVAEAKRSMTHQQFQQEYCASFTEFEGQVYKFSVATQVLDCDPDVLQRLECFAGCDPGYRDATAFVVLGYDPQTEHYWVLDEYEAAAKTTAEHCAKFHEFIQRYHCDPIFIDGAAAQFAADLAYVHDIATVGAKKAVLPGITFLQNIVEQNRLFVVPHCQRVLQVLDQYRWDITTQKERPVHDQYSHMADALRYALYSYVV